jgi:hypothetical protein
MEIKTTADLKTALRNGQYAWPGGYPLYFIADDGEPLSFEAVRDQVKQVMWEIKHKTARAGWRVIACQVNWEDPDLYCAHSGRRIESAYCEG